MVISIDVSEEGDSKWNTRLLESHIGTIYQSIEHGCYQNSIGEKPLFMKFVNSKGDIVGQLLITASSLYKKNGTIKTVFKKIQSSKKMIYKWTYGPVIIDSDFSCDVYSELGNFLHSEKCKVWGSEHPLSKSCISALQKYFKINPWNSFLIDLHKTKDELYNNIEKHSGRKNIERSIKRDVIIEEITDKSFNEYLELLNKQRKESKTELVEEERMHKWWKTFQPIGLTGFLAKKDDVAIGGLLFSFFSKYILEGLVARSSEDYVNKLYSQDLIKWKIIEWGIENKLDYYDLAGANPNPTSEKEKGILRYKKKWGGKKYEYNLIRN